MGKDNENAEGRRREPAPPCDLRRKKMTMKADDGHRSVAVAYPKRSSMRLEGAAAGAGAPKPTPPMLDGGGAGLAAGPGFG